MTIVQDMHQEIQDVLGQNFGIPDDIDEDELMEELDALEDDLTADTEANANGVPSYLQVMHGRLPPKCLQMLLLSCKRISCRNRQELRQVLLSTQACAD